MADDLTRLEDWATPLLKKLEAPQRRKLAADLARDLRRSQQERIKDQRNPDGTPYAPRKAQQKNGRIKRRAMFLKLRQQRYLKAKSSPAEVSVGFFGRVARIARVHQLGLRDEVSPGGPVAQYEKRELLGFSEKDQTMLMDKLISYLS